MRLSLASLALPLLAALARAQDSSSDGRLAKYNAIASKNGGVVPLTTELYDDITSNKSPRSYSVSIVLTALAPKFGCAPCQAFDPEHKQLAKQWWKSKGRKGGANGSQQHFFAVLDYETGQAVFQRMGLNTAPVGQLFLPSQSKPVSYDFARFGPSPDAFASFMASNTGLPITFSKPFDYGKLASAVTILSAIATGSYFFWPVVKFFITSRWVWAVLSLAFMLPMISGYMWCQIRHPPYMTADKQGRAQYIAGGYSNMYGVEVPIVSVVYGVLAFATYTLTVTLPNLNQDSLRQRVGVYLWLGVLAVMASVLVAIFHIKNPGYPFRLLF